MTDPVTIEPLPESIGTSQRLPSIPTVALEVLKITRNPEATIKDLSSAVSRDPALAAKILKLANSSHFRRSNDITTLHKATMMLGMKTVKLMALSFSLTSKLPQQGKVASFDFVEYWRHSLVVAVTGRSFGRLVKSPNADEAFLCGLLSRLGQLVIANSVPDDYSSVIEKTAAKLPSAETESQVLRFDHHRVGAALLASWELPDLIVHTIRYWNQPAALPEAAGEDARELCQIMHVADHISSVICEDNKGLALQALHGLVLKYFGLTEQEVDWFVVGLHSGIVETAALLNIDFSSVGDYEGILAQAREQMVQVSLGTAINLRDTTSRTRELQRENQELELLANTDKLTGMSNRSNFDSTLATVVEARLNGEAKYSLGILIMDVDHFKRFNDTYGHLVGDEVLRKVASSLKEVTRTTDFAARYGGEEFVVILPNTTLRDLKVVAERIRTSVAGLQVDHRGKTLSVTISVGGACVETVSSPQDGNALLEVADSCLYEAKNGGRDRSVCREIVTVPAAAGA